LEKETFSIAYSRPSVSRIRLTLSENISELKAVEINGEVFYKKGSVREIVKIAPEKFTQEHFLKVDGLIAGGYGPTSACETFAKQNGFNIDSFRQQYYKRHFNENRKGKTNDL
jgi:hypothetical protein